jgi:hypothetical protein
VGHINGQATLNGLIEIGQQLLERVAFRGATRDGGDLSPESAFVGLVNHDLQSHGDLLVAVPNVVCSSATSIASGVRTCAQEVSTQAIEHTYAAAAVCGKESGIHTMMSHGEIYCGTSCLTTMARQLGLNPVPR